MTGNTVVLKADLFGTVSLVEMPAGPVIVRDTRPARPWLRWLARHLARREASALGSLEGLAGTPQLMEFDRALVVREWIAGDTMPRARPVHADFYRESLTLLRRIHRAGVTHNDLAKETNWLVTPLGSPALVDFQLAVVHRGRGRLFRMLAREDLRHLLKHKRSYRPHALSARQQRILSTPSALARTWAATGKPVYRFITRRLLGWADREGAGDRHFR